jgi:uncharacterized integral membrane protein
MTNGAEKKRRVPWRVWLAGVLAVLILIFVFQNRPSVTTEYLWATFKAPLWLMLIVTLAVGALIGWLSGRLRRERKDDEKK